jgi:hypothetical protein
MSVQFLKARRDADGVLGGRRHVQDIKFSACGNATIAARCTDASWDVDRWCALVPVGQSRSRSRT